MADYDRYGRYDRSAQNRGYESQGRFGRDRNEDRSYGNQGNYGGSSAQYGQYGQGSSGRDDYRRGGYGQYDQGRGDYGRGDYGRGDYGRRDHGQQDQSGHHGGYGMDYRDADYRNQGDHSRSSGYGTDYRTSYGGDYGRREGSYGRGDQDYGRGYRSDYNRDDDRGFFDRAGDEIRSWFGDDDAERRRRQDAYQGDEGAQHHRGRGPRNYSRSDDRIREDVNDRLTDDPYVDASDIEVSVSNGEVTLSGTVHRRADKRRAEDVAEDVSGVTHVQNNLRVQQAGSMGAGLTGSSQLMDTGATGNRMAGTSLAGMSGTSEAGSSAATSGTKLGGLASTTAEATTRRKAT